MGEPDPDELARLEQALAQLRAIADAELHVAMEQAFTDSPDHHHGPPGPYTAHPSLDQQAGFTRDLMRRGEYLVRLPVRKPLWRFISEPEVEPQAESPLAAVLDVKRAFGPAPYVGRPFLYAWKVAVDRYGRWIGGDEVEVVRR